jgi:transposase-like protein
MGRKQAYGPQFKEEACRLVTGQGHSAAEAARRLGIMKPSKIEHDRFITK